MMLLLFFLIGMVFAAFISYALDMKTELAPAIALGALGGLLGGLALYAITPFWAGMIGVFGAFLGAGIMLWLGSLVGR